MFVCSRTHGEGVIFRDQQGNEIGRVRVLDFNNSTSWVHILVNGVERHASYRELIVMDEIKMSVRRHKTSSVDVKLYIDAPQSIRIMRREIE